METRDGKLQRRKNVLSTAELRECAAHLHRVGGGILGKFILSEVSASLTWTEEQQQTRLMSHLQKKKKKCWKGREVLGQISKAGVVCPALSPQWLADLCTTHRLIRTHRVVQRPRWQTADAGWIQEPVCVVCVCVCCLPPPLSTLLLWIKFVYFPHSAEFQNPPSWT